jgi:NADH:ubiquinone oxidoreductase subunit F (NADH-binding)
VTRRLKEPTFEKKQEMNYEQLLTKASTECRGAEKKKGTGDPQKIALRNRGSIDPDNIYEYISCVQGYSGLSRTLGMSREDVIKELSESGLRGRGGGGYPTAVKWEICRDTGEGEKYILCNAVDADPKSHIARVLLEGDPHYVLEGMLIGAYAVGAGHGFICTNNEYNAAIDRLNKALEQMKGNGLLGDNVLDSDFSFDIEIKGVETSLVSGEETALIRFLEGRQPMPYRRTVYPAVKGINDKPTLVNNVETLSHVSAVFQNGAGWYAAIGTGESPGTKLLTLTGDLVKENTVEVPFGATFRTAIEDSGTVNAGDIKAIQFGGPTGIFLAPESLDTPITFETVSEIGGIMGSGTIEVFDNTHCAVAMARDAIDYIESQSCGKCTFCREGSLQMADILKDISENKGKPADLELLQELGEAMASGSICGLGKTAANPLLSSLRLFLNDYESHINEKKCIIKKAGS